MVHDEISAAASFNLATTPAINLDYLVAAINQYNMNVTAFLAPGYCPPPPGYFTAPVNTLNPTLEVANAMEVDPEVTHGDADDILHPAQDPILPDIKQEQEQHSPAEEDSPAYSPTPSDKAEANLINELMEDTPPPPASPPPDSHDLDAWTQEIHLSDSNDEETQEDQDNNEEEDDGYGEDNEE